MKAPKHLRPDTRRWFESVIESYELEAHHVRLLRLAGEAWDRCQQAREILAESGLTYLDKNGCPKPRPEVAIERDSRTGFARLVRELQLDIAAPADDVRVPRLSMMGRAVKAVGNA